jgi:hypothetical protein
MPPDVVKKVSLSETMIEPVAESVDIEGPPIVTKDGDVAKNDRVERDTHGPFHSWPIVAVE